MGRIAAAWSRAWSSRWTRVGVVLTAIGWLPLLVYGVWDSWFGDPKNPGNPIGLGLLTVFLGWPGIACVVTGYRRSGAPDRDRAARGE